MRGPNPQRLLVILIFLAQAGCRASATPVPQDQPTQMMNGPTNTAGAAALVAPSSTPSPTQTPIPTPLPIPLTSYEASRTSLCLQESWVLAVGYADFNRDGREDVVIAPVSGTEERDPIIIRLQGPTGLLVRDDHLLPSPIPGTVHARKVVVADFNGDNVPDIFIADHGFDQPPWPGAASLLLISRGQSYETSAIANMPIGFQHSATAADINGDGAPDIFVMDSSNGAFLLVNDGSGQFTVTRQGIPFMQRGFYTSELIDLDGDGFYDLLVGGHEHEGAATRVLWGDDSGTYTLGRSTIVPGDLDYRIVLDFDAEDLDGDGTSELLVTRTRSQPFYDGYYFQLLELSERTFSDVSPRIVPDRLTWEGAAGRWIPWVVLRDFNADGHFDILTVENGCGMVYLNDGSGVFYRQR